MAAPRFHLAPAAWHSPSTLILEGDEAHHCHSVMRRGIGDEVQIFDGAGRCVRATITSSSSKRVELQAVDGTDAKSEPPAVQITLLQAIPKGSNIELIIEKAVELGVQHIYPVLTEHTVVKLKAEDAAKKQSKWQRIALEACKQCGQNWLPEVHTPMAYSQVWQQLPQHDLRLIAAILPQSESFKTVLSRGSANPASVLIAIGPEGDFSANEYQTALEAGCQPVTLGSIILRVETAAMFCLSVLSHELLLPSQQQQPGGAGSSSH